VGCFIKSFTAGFTPSWFTIASGTGGLAIILALFPFDTRGVFHYAGFAAWALTAVMFLMALSLLLSRAVLYPKTLPALLEHPSQSLFLGAVPMALSTLTGGVILFFGPLAGKHAEDAARALALTNLPLILSCVVMLPALTFTRHEHSMESATALWLLPVVPAVLGANTTGVISRRISSAEDSIELLIIGADGLQVWVG